MADARPLNHGAFATRVLIVIGILILVVALYFLRLLVLMTFIAIILANFWSAGVHLVEHRISQKIPRPPIVVLVGLLSLGTFGLVGYLLLDPIREQFQSLVADLPEVFENLQERFEPILNRTGILNNGLPDVDWGGMAASGVEALQAGFRGLVGFVTILFLALFFAFQPDRYRRGVIRMFPRARRERVDALIAQLTDTLTQWLKATGAMILFVGITSTLLLWIIGIPYPILFGVAAGLFEIIPFVGPVLGFTGPVLIALSMPFPTVLWVLAAWATVQFTESNIITPSVMAKAVSLPPALTLIAIFAMAELFGFIGVLLAAPTLAVMLKTIEFYNPDVNE
jgi:predicted PurR-regulated permease PerM